MRHIFPGAFLPPPPEPSMPQGLVQLMEGLSRDVIVNNPADVYKFCADHMHKLLQLRDAQKPTPPPKSLEEKIAIAQAKVSARAKERHRCASKTLKTAEITTDSYDETKDGETESNNEKANIKVDNLIPIVSEIALCNAHNENISENENNGNEDNTTIKEDEEEMVKVENTEEQSLADANLGLEEESKNQTEDELKVEIISDLKGLNDEPSPLEHNETIALNSPTDCHPESDTIVQTTESEDLQPDLDSSIVNGNHIEKGNNTNEETLIPSITERIEVNHKEQYEVNNESGNDTKDLVTESANTMGDGKNNAEINVLTENEKELTDFVTNEEPILENDSLTDVNLEVNGEETEATKEDTDAVNINEGRNDQKNYDNASEEVKVASNTKNATETDEKEVLIVNEQENVDEHVLKSAVENIPEENIELISESNNPDELQNEVAISEAPVTVPEDLNENSEIVLRTDTDEDEPNVNTIKSNVEYSDTSKESLKQDKNIDAIEKPNTNSAITDTPNETIHEESSFSELTNGTDDKIDDGNAPQNNEMDLETAAVTIQKVFRSFLINRASTLDDVSNEESLDAPYLPDDITSGEARDDENSDGEFHNAVINKERRGMGITRMDTVLQTVNEEKSLSLSDDSSTLSSAATVIQAHVRGFLVRNRMHSHKTTSTNSFVEGSSAASMDADNEQSKNKTVLNIRIVPEGGHYLSREESMAMSVELPLDGSPPTSSSLHSLGYDITERRKLLKREDAIQSISPPSNNSGNSDVSPNGNDLKISSETIQKEDQGNIDIVSGETTPTKSTTVETVLEVVGDVLNSNENKMSSDENDVVTPFVTSEEMAASEDTPRLLHSGEFHDLALPLPTRVLRSDSPVVREFKNVLGYFLIWNYSSS